MFTRDNHNKREREREREREEGFYVTLAGLNSTASPGLPPRLVTRPQASMKEGYTGDESTWIHRDDDYGSRQAGQGGAAPEFATERVASASGANRSNKLSSLKRCSGFAII